MFGSKDLKPRIFIAESTVECPVIGCAEKVKRQRKSFKRKPEFQCLQHKLYISPTTFEYPRESDNFLWTSPNDKGLLKNIKKVKRESRRPGITARMLSVGMFFDTLKEQIKYQNFYLK
jgi:hypothetical protein